ncbi:hypothetical protein [Actinomadura coerulea]|uniref:hypothetical protein n=1 Tax=Actinomadura coerulea TaxID=46159 RepID=UPI0034315DCA
MPDPQPRLTTDGGPPDFTVLADALIRRAFTVSMDLHRDLARLSPRQGDHASPRQQVDGRPGPPAAVAPTDRPVAPAEAERLRGTLRRAISALDGIIHDLRAAALAHAIAPQAPPTLPATPLSPDGLLHTATSRVTAAERWIGRAEAPGEPGTADGGPKPG